MNSHSRRRDDRSAADPYKQWLPPADKYPPDYDSDRRRNRSATLPARPYDPRSYPSHDPRYNDPRQPARTQRQDPHYPSAAPSAHPSYHPPSAPIPSTSKAYQHATRPSAQYSSSGYHYPQPSSYQPSHSTPAYPVASSSRRPHPDAPDPRASRRPANHPSYEYVSSGEEMSRAPRHPSRPTHPSAQPSSSATANQQFWNPPQDMSSSRRPKDPYRDRDRDHERERDRERDKERERDPRDRDRERERDKERDKPEPETRYKDRTRPDRHRERERVTEVRPQEPTRSKHHDKRKDSDTEGVTYPEQRNASKVSLTAKEGHPSSTREPTGGHRRHRAEDGIVSTGRRLQPENTQNPITTMPSQHTNAPPLDVQQTGEPPPAPRVMPVYLPPKAKSQRSHREGRPSTAQGAQSGSDTERATGKHRMERTPSGPATQRSDPYTSNSTRERTNHDTATGPRDDVKRMEGKYGIQHDSRQPLAPINVDIPLVTPGFNASALPSEVRIATAPQRVSIRAGQGPSDPHDAYSKSSTTPHPDAPQEITVHPPSSASIVKSSSHTPSRSQSSEPQPQYDRPTVVEQLRTEPHGCDLPPGQRMSVHESSRVLPTSISKTYSYARGNPEIAAENASASYPHSRPPSRSAHRAPSSNAVPPAVVGPRPLRSASQGPYPNEPSTRPPSVAQYAPIVNPPQIHYSVPPSPVHVTNGSPPKAENAHGSLSSAHPSPKNAPQLHGVSLSHSNYIQQGSSVPPTTYPTPITTSQPLATSRPSTRDGAHTDAPPVLQQTAERQLTDDRQGLRQTSNGTTVKASWVVQTPATVKKARISREDKYLPRQNVNSETPHPQLRQVLSQDSDPFPRASSSMMKASQATTPTTSQRNSPGTKTRESLGTPRGTIASGSPRSWSVKEAPTPEHIPRPTLRSHLTGPPQIAVVGATPITSARELPQGRVDHTLLAPPFPAPTRASRTTSNSQDQQSQSPQPVVRTTSSSQPPPPVHAPSLFQPYRPPSLPPAEDTGQSSPPALPIPPPKGPEDSPPSIETRTSEIIRARSHDEEHPQSHGQHIPEVKSEMFHVPSQPSASSQLLSVAPSRTPQPWQTGKLDSNAMISNGPIPVAQHEASSLKPVFDDVQVLHQEIMVSVPGAASQSFVPPTKSRPKATVEDVTEDSPVLSKARPTSVPAPPAPGLRSQPSQHTTAANASPTSKPPVADSAGHRSSPQSRNKETPLYPSTEPSTTLSATPISTGPSMSTRVPSSAPPTQPATATFTQALPTQRTASHTTSRTYHRATEMLQADKLLASVGTHPGASGSVNNRSTGTPMQAAYNPVGIAAGYHQQLASSVNAPGPSAPRVANTSLTAPQPSVSAPAFVTKGAGVYTTVNNPGPSAGTPGLFAPSTSINAQQPPVPDVRHQLNRPGASTIPPLDATSTAVMSTTAIKNTHQEPDTNRLRDVTPSVTRNLAPSSHVYPTSSRPGISSTMTQQTLVTPAQPSAHHRTVSLPIASSSSAPQRPPSPRKHSQPIPSATVSTQPFPSRPSVPDPQSTRAPVPGNIFPPAQARSARPPPERTLEPEMLKTPSSIAPSPMLNPDTSTTVPQPVPMRARQSSTDSKDDKKKPTGLFGLLRTRTFSLKAADPPSVPTATRASLDQGRVHPEPSNVATTSASTSRVVTSASAPKEWNSAQTPAPTISARTGSQTKATGGVPVPFPPPPQMTRERKDPPHMFTPFKLLSMHTNKRDRTVSAASLDVCDGNTATNTVVGSPDHSAISQAQPLPRIIPPDIRDPLIATSEWRDREEAERRDRRKIRIRRPGVTFDVEEEPPSPAPGTSSKRKKLIRRPTGRSGTPGPRS